MRKTIHGKVPGGDANTILCYCPLCGYLKPVEEHGRDRCPTCLGNPYLENIPRDCQDMSGLYMVRKPPLEKPPIDWGLPRQDSTTDQIKSVAKSLDERGFAIPAMQVREDLVHEMEQNDYERACREATRMGCYDAHDWLLARRIDGP